MSMPGFQAEASLSRSPGWITTRLNNQSEPVESRVQPATLKSCISNCEEVCEGDVIGACMPWCLCRCHGGKNCGRPS
jgi:hypothetical protein